MADPEVMRVKLERAFTAPQAALLAEVITETLDEGHKELIKVHDFNKLKEIVESLGEKVERLAEAQERTEARLEKLAEAQERTEARLEKLAEAQERTEARLEKLAEAQERTEARLEKLAEAQERTEDRVGGLEKAMAKLAEAQERTEERVGGLEKAMAEFAAAHKEMEQAVAALARSLDATRADLGGLARSVAYSLENEAYRALPALMRQYGIEVTERFVRTEVEGEEINLLGKGRRNGAEVVIVGEAELRLTGVSKIRQLLRKADLVAKKYPGEIVKVLVTHYARPQVIEKAREHEVLVVQSFEWL